MLISKFNRKFRIFVVSAIFSSTHSDPSPTIGLKRWTWRRACLLENFRAANDEHCRFSCLHNIRCSQESSPFERIPRMLCTCTSSVRWKITFLWLIVSCGCSQPTSARFREPTGVSTILSSGIPLDLEGVVVLEFTESVSLDAVEQ